MTTEQLANLVNLALLTLNRRLLTLIALALNAAVAFWAASADSWVRLAAEGIFALASWFILNYTPPTGAQHET